MEQVVFIVESEHWQVDMREALERYVPQQKEALDRDGMRFDDGMCV